MNKIRHDRPSILIDFRYISREYLLNSANDDLDRFLIKEITETK